MGCCFCCQKKRATELDNNSDSLHKHLLYDEYVVDDAYFKDFTVDPPTPKEKHERYQSNQSFSNQQQVSLWFDEEITDEQLMNQLSELDHTLYIEDTSLCYDPIHR
jgi:hypothetical protein